MYQYLKAISSYQLTHVSTPVVKAMCDLCQFCLIAFHNGFEERVIFHRGIWILVGAPELVLRRNGIGHGRERLSTRIRPGL